METYSNNDVLELKLEIEKLKKQIESNNECLKICNTLAKKTSDAYEITIDNILSRCTCQKK
jgi:hypothetical protein